MTSLGTIRLLAWWLVFCKETRRKPLISPWHSCRIHTWWTHFCCILWAAPELLACPHSREVSWIPPLDSRLTVTLQKAKGRKTWLWSSIMSNLLCKSSGSYKYRDRRSGEGCKAPAVSKYTDPCREPMAPSALTIFLSLFILSYFRWINLMGDWSFGWLCCFLYSGHRSWKMCYVC